MDFIPNTEAQKKEMLNVIGVSSVQELFRDIPVQAKKLKIDGGLSELELTQRLKAISDKNKITTSFLGAGAYNHFIPSVVNHIISRSEFYTAYTPYQPEISQGMLQSIFEYQTMIAGLTGMDVANASMYDGASALAEACNMAINITRKNQIIILKSVHPEYRQVVKTYCKAHGYELIEADKPEIIEKTAALLVQNPNFFGSIEDIKKYADLAHEKNALLVTAAVEATSLGILKAPGSLGADIVAGEGQSFGNSVNFGGPYLGILATKEKYVRYLAGRLVGETVDATGERGFILTLQAREQHIRREKASCNICSNEALCALAASVHLAILGKTGLKELAELNIQKAHYLADKLKEIGYSLVFDKPFYNEFVVKNAKGINEKLLKNNIIGGLDLTQYYPELKDCMLFCVTEVITKEEMDKVIELLKQQYST